MYGQQVAASCMLGGSSEKPENSTLLQTQLEMGFQRVGGDLEDIDLDFPNASKLYAGYRAQAVREGWLSDLAEPVQVAA